MDVLTSDTDSDATTCDFVDMKVIPDSLDSSSITEPIQNSRHSGFQEPRTNEEFIPQCSAISHVFDARPGFRGNFTLDELLFGENQYMENGAPSASVTMASNSALSKSPKNKAIATQSRQFDSGIGSHESRGISLSGLDDQTINPSVTEVTSDERLICGERPTTTDQLNIDLDLDDRFCRPNFSYPPLRARRPLVLSCPTISSPMQIPSSINQYLRVYQQEGVQFLSQHHANGTGALLFDESGLGKTVQVITLMAAILRKTGRKSDLANSGAIKGSFMVVCHECTLLEWKFQLELWSYLTYRVCYHGENGVSIHDAREEGKEVIIVTYEAVTLHYEELNELDWMAIVCDDVQVIKNPDSLEAKAMNSLKERRRIGLMDGSLQTSLEELWNILNWTNPNCLGSLEDFRLEFAVPISDGRRSKCTKRQASIARQSMFIIPSTLSKHVH